MPSNPPRWIHDFDDPPSATGEDRIRLLGGKGANLAVMSRELGLPVPPGFTVTTAACAAFRASGWPDGAEQELRAAVERLGERLGRRFGDAGDPLLVSVRSGAPVSMPGMMDTILDLGLTEATVRGLAQQAGNRDFAADCLRRFHASWAEVIGGEPPGDPWDQLRAAVEAVFASWDSDRARAFRQREGIADDLGTAVTVQAMVFGNLDARSATGVLFTRDPATGAARPYGDVLFEAQGEDVVAGTHATAPIGVLEERLPAVGAELREVAARLERHYADLCDIEFTVERGRLWLLQVRTGKRSPAAALRMAIEMAEDPAFPVSRQEAVRRVAPLLADPPTSFVADGEMPSPLASGLSASPGVATGIIATSAPAAEAAAEAGKPVILVRSETSPEDVRGMARSVGILTARGGLASHAAVVARGWGIPAVVGAQDMRLSDDTVEIGGHVFQAGTELTIDGDSGNVYLGSIPGHREVLPDVKVLRGWADALGIPIPAPSRDLAASTPGPAMGADVAADDVIRTLSIKGTASVEQLADALRADASAVETQIGALRDQSMVDGPADAARLTPAGRDRGSALFGSDRDRVGVARAGEALESFAAHDGRMKSIVTAWQLRDVDGAPVLNDHADEAYDAGVLDDLAALHGEVGPWLDGLADTLPRFATYRARLDRAAERAAGGEGAWIASPRVDSYHSAWFELHEELIRLAGRTREDEAAAGRA
ncbi:MAG TPA: pyruvate, phosphate dikinase [Candidatus Limnocylindria bacterium]|nr:pyruvate, phosphate dikinase [Candidatus Limnocylindria bacterium]